MEIEDLNSNTYEEDVYNENQNDPQTTTTITTNKQQQHQPSLNTAVSIGDISDITSNTSFTTQENEDEYEHQNNNDNSMDLMMGNENDFEIDQETGNISFDNEISFRNNS